MISEPLEILKKHPVRKSKEQKAAFRGDVQAYCENLGYAVSFEKTPYKGQNMIIGDQTKAKYLITAHYDTSVRMLLGNTFFPKNLIATILLALPTIVMFGFLGYLIGYSFGTGKIREGFLYLALFIALDLLKLFGPANRSNSNDNTSGVVTLLEIARTLPVSLRDKVCFVLFDMEEAGLVGSSAYRKAHKEAVENQIVLNMDCVGDGDEILLFPTKKFRKDGKKLAWLYKAIGRYGDKTIDVPIKGYANFNSDQKSFPYGVGIAAFKRKKLLGLCIDRIHTPKDTNLDLTNVNILRACLTTLVTGDAAE